MKRDNARIEHYTVGATYRVKIAEKNPYRWFLKIRTTSSNGLYIGFDEGLESGGAYFIQEDGELKMEMWQGEVWALSPTGSADVYVYEESSRRESPRGNGV